MKHHPHQRVDLTSCLILVSPSQDEQVPMATSVLGQEDGASLGNHARGFNFPLDP